MKKISLFALTAVALVAGLTGCKDDTQPRLDVPTEFVLNTPAMAEQTYIFRDNEKYQNLNDITFTVSQPNYGVATTPNYQVQIAKTEEAFAEWDAAEKTGDTDSDNEILGSDELPLAILLETVTSSAQITIPGEVFCEGVNTLYNIDPDNYNHETLPVAVRVKALLPNAPQSEIWSNAININVSSYIPVKEPGKLYVIGAPSGWDINNDEISLDETGIGTKIFTGVFFIDAEKFQFRLYSKLGDWESFSIGSQDDDNPVDISFNAAGVYEGKIFMGKKKGDKLGKGSWQDASWPGGNVEVTVNTKEMTITIQKAQAKKIYVIGALSGWNINNDAVYIEENPGNSNIYVGTIPVNAGDCMFRFYTKLGEWGSDGSIGADSAGNLDVDLSSPFIGKAVAGSEQNWNCPNWTDGQLGITLDLNSNTINLERK